MDHAFAFAELCMVCMVLLTCRNFVYCIVLFSGIHLERMQELDADTREYQPIFGIHFQCPGTNRNRHACTIE